MRLENPSLLRIDAYINGNWQSAGDDARFEVINPATGQCIAQVADCSSAQTALAIESAQQAFESWRKTSARQRGQLLCRWASLMEQHQQDLATILTAEQGKPLAEAVNEIGIGQRYVQWAAEEGRRVYGRTIPAPTPDKRFIVKREPVGVCAQITPWNFPSSMITRKAAAALAAGCTVVCKPSELTPLSALALAQLADEAGFPAGVINILPTLQAESVGLELSTNPAVRHLSFTGSTAVGKQLMAQCASTAKKISLELGGNAPLIVFDDADLDLAVAGALASKFRNSGQTCICANRLLVQGGIYNDFLEKFSNATAALTIGDGLAGTFDQGPLIDQRAVQSMEYLLDDALKKGANIAVGGQRHELGRTFFQPTVLAGASADMRVASDEIFGPVMPVFEFGTESEAIELANATEYGLAAYFYARDNARIWRVMDALEYGMIGVNETAITDEAIPFGGIKQSGTGREGGKEGLEEYLETRFVCIGGIE